MSKPKFQLSRTNVLDTGSCTVCNFKMDYSVIEESGRKSVAITGISHEKGEPAQKSLIIPNLIGTSSGLLPVTHLLFSSTYIREVEDLTIPEEVEYIKKSAFAKMPNLKSVIFKGTSEILLEPEIFKGCTELTSVEINRSMTTLSNSIFEDCQKLTNVTLSDSLKYLGDAAFRGCVMLKYFDFPKELRGIDRECFNYCNSLADVKLPENLKDIFSSAFKSCTALTHITIPDSVKFISSNAFVFCENLQNVKMGNSVIELGPAAFAYCDSLENVTLSDNIHSMVATFANCPSIKEIRLPKKLKCLGDLTFTNCDSLKEITAYGNISEIAPAALDRGYSYSVPSSEFTFRCPENSYIWNAAKKKGYKVRALQTQLDCLLGTIPDDIPEIRSSTSHDDSFER